MIVVGSLEQGDLFSPAHPKQVSRNGFRMSQDDVFVVSKIFTVDPFMYICRMRSNFAPPYQFSLLPETPVRLPEERRYSEDEVDDFLINGAMSTKVIGFKINIDPSIELESVLTPAAAKVAKVLFLTGRREMTRKEIRELFDSVSSKNVLAPNYERFMSRTRELKSSGVLVPVVSTSQKLLRSRFELIGV